VELLQRGLTLAEVAARLGMHERSISRYFLQAYRARQTASEMPKCPTVIRHGNAEPYEKRSGDIAPERVLHSRARDKRP